MCARADEDAFIGRTGVIIKRSRQVRCDLLVIVYIISTEAVALAVESHLRTNDVFIQGKQNSLRGKIKKKRNK